MDKLIGEIIYWVIVHREFVVRAFFSIVAVGYVLIARAYWKEWKDWKENYDKK